MAAAAGGCRGAAGGRAPRAWDGQEKAVIREIPLQDTATLETELSALQRRQLRLAPEMDRCGEPLY